MWTVACEDSSFEAAEGKNRNTGETMAKLNNKPGEDGAVNVF